MWKICLIVLGLVIQTLSLKAQLVTTNTLTIQQYVQDVLLGQNVSVSNITFNGGNAAVNNVQVGEFEGTNSNLGIGSGFMMSSGSVNTAQGPVDFFSSSALGNNNSTDPDLMALANSNGVTTSANDWCIIEFDFIPLGDTLRFNYVWASEEYPEYVAVGGTTFNDFFGFFLSGPGINGPYANNAENIALIPGTNVPVSIGNLNNGNANAGPCDYCEFYIQDFEGGYCQPTDPVYNDPYYMSYDGYTTLLTAVGIVQCGLTYHIKLAIADGGDGGFDSAVFLERDSFSSNLVVQVELNFEVGGPEGNSLYENCGTGELIFSRPESYSPDNEFVAYLAYDGTAQMNVDYSALPDSIVFPPGIINVAVPVDAFTDGLTEGSETVHMVITNLAQCSEVTLESEFNFFINDEAEPLVVDGYEEDICTNGSVELIPIISGGYAVYNYDWSTGETSETITVSPIDDTVYNIIVSDTCGMPSDDANISIIVGYPPMTLSLTPDPVVVPCNGLNLTANTSGGNGTYTYSWLNAEGQDMFGWMNTLYLSTWNFTEEITVNVEDGCGETGQVVVYPTSSVQPMVVTQETTIEVACAGPYTISPTVTGGSAPYYYSWYDQNWNWMGSNPTYTLTVNGNTYVNVNISDNCGFNYSSQINFTIVPVPITLSLPQNFSGSCTEVFTIVPDVSGGGGTFTYQWQDQGTTVGTGATLAYNTNTTTDIQLNVTDACGSSANATTTITIINTPPVLTLSPSQTATCIEEKTFTADATNGEQPYNYSWTVNGLPIAAGNVAQYQANETTDIICTVIDACGLSDEETVSLIINNPAIELTITPDSTICLGDIINLETTVQGGVGIISYFWPTVLDEAENILSHVNVRPSSSQVYEVLVSDECGQIDSISVDIEVQYVISDFSVNFLNDYDVILVALGADSCLDCTYAWDFGDGSAFVGDSVMHTFDGLDQYQIALTVTNSIGCSRTSYEVVYPEVQLFIPNSFTPDGDGINDVWAFQANGILTFDLKIFNRWGDVIFETKDPTQPWTGDVRSGEYYARDGIYSWILTYSGVDGDAKSKTGSLTVFR